MTYDQSPPQSSLTVGVLALQGAFSEHIQLLKRASKHAALSSRYWTFIEVRTQKELESCDALILPGGESTTMSLVAQRSNLLEPLRDFVKVQRKPVWGTCAGLILLSESANVTSAKKGGQELIGGLDIRVQRNAFGRQVESFESDLALKFLGEHEAPYRSVFIRAPIVEAILEHTAGPQVGEAEKEGTIVAPSKVPESNEAKARMSSEVEILARLSDAAGNGRIVAVRQGNCFGTSFHPELAEDERIHVWWLGEVVKSVEAATTQAS